MTSQSQIDRRRFIKTFAFATACSSLLGKTWTTVVAGQIAPQSTSTTGTLRLKVSNFPALQSESGSVRLAINPLNGNTGPIGQFYPVIINRAPKNVFYALNSRCSHQACIVEALDSSSDLMHCLCHGSFYAIDGRRVAGPAPSALTKYAITFDGSDLLEIKIPGLGYAITASPVESTGQGVRMRLDFRGLRNVDYEVQFRETLDKEAVVIPFSLTMSDPADQTVFTAATTASVSLFVDRKTPSGFYSVAIRLTEA